MKHRKLTPEEAEAFKLAVRPNSAETSHDIMCSISAFSTWRALNQGLLPVRSIADLQSTWYRWLERMSCRLQGSYGQPQLSQAEADAFSLAVRPNHPVSSLSKGWSRPSYVDSFSAYTQHLCESMESYLLSGAVSAPNPFGTDVVAVEAYRNYQLLQDTDSIAYERMSSSESA